VSDLVAGVARAVSPLVRRIVAPNPGLMTGPGTNTYLVGIDEIAVIDPGPDVAAHLDAIAACAGDRVRWILVTHTHPDHAPGAAGLRERTGGEVLGFDARDGFEPDTGIAEGFRLEATEFTLTAVHTPGHASNHLCYLLERARVLFSGDHVMQGSTVVIRPPDGDMRAYLESLRRLLTLRLEAIAPGHGHLIEDPDAAVEAYLTHRAEREGEVISALAAGDRTVDEIVARVYASVAAELHPVARHSVHAHLLKLAAEGRTHGSSLEGSWEPADSN
jgi:glyoxylase-like metal-dependent hydrolase (beta-lactamase superfamily II)